jgi:hypothetical protein
MKLFRSYADRRIAGVCGGLAVFALVGIDDSKRDKFIKYGQMTQVQRIK